MRLDITFKNKVREAILKDRENYDGNDVEYAKKLGIDKAIYNRMKKGETEKLISDTKWLIIANDLGVKLREDNWKIARTQIYSEIEDNLAVCKETGMSMILVDDCRIGKTFCAKHIVRQMKNAFYVDCSQAKTKQQFIRLLAKTIGVDNTGRYTDVKTAIKTYLIYLEKPLIVLDEAGDLDYNAFLELKELWNAAPRQCGWYMIGADGLRAKIDRGVSCKKVGYAEIFDRYSNFVKLVPTGTDDKEQFYRKLIGDVAYVNVEDKEIVGSLIATFWRLIMLFSRLKFSMIIGLHRL